MCIAILNKKDSILKDDALINSYNNNPDGCGFAYLNSAGKFIIDKGLFKQAEFLEKYKQHKKIAASDMLIHCRISTAGKIDAVNAHPHIINNDAVLIHNGCLNIEMPFNSAVSDTIIFIDRYLKDISIEQLKSARYRLMLTDFIGINNKFVILDKTGAAYIINKKQGVTDVSGNWYSNSSYQNINKWDMPLVYLSKKEKKKLKHKIEHLSLSDFEMLGETPYVKMSDLSLHNTDIDIQPECFNIWDIEDLSIPELYTELYKTAMDYYRDFNYA